MTLRDFDAWRMEVSYLLQETIDSKQTYELALDTIATDGTAKSQGTVPVIEVLSYYKVVQIIGELKSHFSDRKLRILLRGQKKSYGYIQLPKIFRLSRKNYQLTEIINDKFDFSQNNSPWKILLSEEKKVEQLIDLEDFPWKTAELDDQIRGFQRLNKSTFIGKSIPNMLAWESIMQHYDKKTRYIDLVESIPIALCFASKYNKKTSIPKEKVEDDHGYVFIYGVRCDEQIAKGVWDGPYQRLINLSEATTPLSLRPHMQSAFSLSQKQSHGGMNKWQRTPNLTYLSSRDYAKFLLCIFKIKQKHILEWLCVNRENHYYLYIH